MASIRDEVVDINLSEVQRKRFRIDGDDNRILELNISDLNLLSRLREAYPKLVSLASDAFTNMPDATEDENVDFMTDPNVTATIEILKDVDTQMRELLDYIFDAKVSEVCAPSGNMYDPINGKLRYEYIVERLSDLYEKEISTEMGKIAQRVNKHTAKYNK